MNKYLKPMIIEFAFNGGSCTLNGDTLTINFNAWTNYMDFQINCITHDIS